MNLYESVKVFENWGATQPTDTLIDMTEIERVKANPKLRDSTETCVVYFKSGRELHVMCSYEVMCAKLQAIGKLQV